ncbi:hypothetical protein PIROE2DRAFT_14439, partial [Piromyces sp. E2]
IDVDEILEKFGCDSFYIDKSLLIKEFIDYSRKKVCVTRPLKYGKTTNLIMMREFFQMNDENEINSENRKIFEQLNIAKEVDRYGQKYIDGYLGKYPVIFLDFDELKIENSYNKTINNFKSIIQSIYYTYESTVYEKLNKFKKEEWNNFMESETNNNKYELVNSISFLCECLKNVLNKNVILLIDNYDSPILNAFDTEFYDEFYSFYKDVFMSIFNEDRKNYFLFKTFITGNFFISFLENANIYSYDVMDNKYDEFYSITDTELEKLLSELKLEDKTDKKFKEYCNGNIYSCLNSTVINNTNIFISSSFSNSIAATISSTIADTITSVDASSAFITNINENIFNIYNSSSVLHINIFKVFKNFDYLLIKDINYLLQNGNIEDNFLDVDMSSKNNINNNREHFIWRLLMDCGYFIVDNTNEGFKIRNKATENFIKKKFLEESMKNVIEWNTFLDRYYDLILVLLSLDNQSIVITKNNYNERHDIRELLVVKKKYLDIFKKNNTNSRNKNDNSNSDSNENTTNKIDNSNSNDNKDTNNGSNYYSYIIYITIKGVNGKNKIENGCISALEDNENFNFDDRELKELYDKIIKFGIAFCYNHCD